MSACATRTVSSSHFPRCVAGQHRLKSPKLPHRTIPYETFASIEHVFGKQRASFGLRRHVYERLPDRIIVRIGSDVRLSEVQDVGWNSKCALGLSRAKKLALGPKDRRKTSRELFRDMAASPV